MGGDLLGFAESRAAQKTASLYLYVATWNEAVVALMRKIGFMSELDRDRCPCGSFLPVVSDWD